MKKQETKKPGLYIAGLVLGILAVCFLLNPFFAFICGILALVFGSVTYSNGFKEKAPIILGIIGWYLMFLLCRLSTYDVLNDCMIKEEDKKSVNKGMKLLFIVLIIVSLIFTLAILYLRIQSAATQILINSTQNDSVFSPNFNKILLQRDINNFELYRSVTIRTTFIQELFFIISIFSLGPFQAKMIDTYNEK